MNMSPKRIAALQQKLKENNLDAAVYATGAHFVYLLDIQDFWFQRYSVTLGPDTEFATPTLTRPETLIWVPQEGAPVLFSTPRRAKELTKTGYDVIVTYVDYFKKRLADYINGGRVAVGLSCKDEVTQMIKDADACHGGTVEVVYGEQLVDELRMIKDEKEIGLLRKAAALTDYAMEQIIPILKPGITPYEVEKKIAQIGFDNGAEDLAFSGSCIFVEKGHPTAVDPYIFPRNRGMRVGTGIAFDMGYVLNGYSSDYGRSFFYGEPSQEAVESYKALQAAQCYMVDHIVPGKTSVTEISDIIYEGLEQFGRGHQLRHHEQGGQGHQIGIEVHELPWIHRNNEGILKPGMVFCSEPKIFIPDEIYMRVEDMILVTETGAEFLTVFDRDLFRLDQ